LIDAFNGPFGKIVAGLIAEGQSEPAVLQEFFDRWVSPRRNATIAEPAAEWLPAEIARDEKGFLLTGADVLASGSWPRKDREPCALETNVPGVLAAGDIRAGSVKSVGFAVGDGSLAVTCAHRLITING
jgi:hypothetical protein